MSAGVGLREAMRRLLTAFSVVLLCAASRKLMR